MDSASLKHKDKFTGIFPLFQEPFGKTNQPNERSLFAS